MWVNLRVDETATGEENKTADIAIGALAVLCHVMEFSVSVFRVSRLSLVLTLIS